MKNLNKAIHRNPKTRHWTIIGDLQSIVKMNWPLQLTLNKTIEISPNKAVFYYRRGRIRAKSDTEFARKDLQHARKLAKQTDDKELIGKIEKSLSSIENSDDEV